MYCQLTFRSLINNQAILVNKEGQEFIWPADQLPQNSQIGSIFNCALINPSSLDQSDQAMAKNILNEILNI